MATVPIEIIIQDAEGPVTPTPESGGETNIVVPDTGAGTINNTSNSGGIGSSAGIILPVIIAVLAIGAMVAMLVHKHHKHQNDKLSKKEKLTTVASGTIAILAATVLVGNLVMPATNAATSVEPGTADLETEDKITIIATREQDSDGAVIATVQNTSYATANLDFGYKVTASMAEGLDNANLYLDGDETSEYYFSPVEDGVLENNTWGYTLEEPSEGTTYLPIPLVGTPATITKGNDMVEDVAVDIYYTIKVDKDMPAGTYAGEIEYNISPAVEYMQDFATMTEEEKTAAIANMPEGQQYILKDIRDEKPYYISKLADGNVWMTQNLDLDLDKDIVLTPANTNIKAEWKPASSTLAMQGTSAPGWENSSTVPYSADPGMLFIYSSGSTDNDGQYTALVECQQYHSDCSMHNHAGNYYNWSAAVASNDTSEITDQYTDVATSICPAGWRLPNIIGSGTTVAGSEWGTLLFTEKITTDAISGEYSTDGFRDIRKAYLWLTRSGGFLGSSLNFIGSFGTYWSSTVANSSNAYCPSFSSSGVFPVGTSGRGDGFSIRCVTQ